MDKTLFDKYEKPRENDGLQATSARQELINSIVDQMYTAGRPLTVEEKKHTAKRFAIAANTLGFTNTDLHYLANRNNFPSVNNYSAFVNSRFKVKHKPSNER